LRNEPHSHSTNILTISFIQPHTHTHTHTHTTGKSTSVDTLSAYLGDEDCATIPMDGYHYSLEELSKFLNPADAIYRRGAPDTFNVMALARDLERIAFGHQPEGA